MATVPQKELRNKVGEILRRAESGEEITITVSGRPVAQLGPLRTRQWVEDSVLEELAALPPDPRLATDIEQFGGDLGAPGPTANGARG
jgi:prevent-host-death family protein